MHVTARSYLTAGVAALGVGALALAPVQPIPNQVALAPHRAVSTLAVELASTIDPITPWVDTFTTAGANIATLFEFYMQKPFPLLQTVGANIGTYVVELGNGNAGLIPEQIWGNVQTFFQAPWDPGPGVEIPYSDGPQLVPTGEYVSDYAPPAGQTPSGVANFVLLLIAQQFVDGCDTDDSCSYKAFIPLVRFLEAPYSGQLVALVGTLISPFVQLVRSFTAIGGFFQDGDVIGAINELINIPANMTNASLNGAGFLDLTGIVSAIAPDAPLDKVGVNLGGLLNVMPFNGGRGQTAGSPDVPTTEWSGGVGIDSLAVGEPDSFDYAQGVPNGLLGANIGLGQFLAEKLLVTPPPPPPVAAEPEAAKLAAPLDIPAPAVAEAPVEEAAPAVVDVPAEETAPAVAEVVAEESAPAAVEVVAEESAPAVDDIAEIEAAIEAVEASESEPAGAATPAAEDSGPEAASDSDTSDDDTDRSGSKNRRGAS
jgi:hypothetical protein